MRRIAVLAAGMALGLASVGVASVGPAEAHAMLRKAAPAVGSIVPGATQVVLDFTEALEPHFTTITVLDAQGQPVDSGDKHLADDNPKRLVVGLKPLAAGTYKVVWHATSVDTHKTEGAFEFTVRP